MKRTTSRVLKSFGWLALTLIVLLALLQTTPGKRAFASALSKALSEPGVLDVRIGTIGGWIPGNVRVDLLEIGDSEGVWLSVRAVHCRWVIRELLAGRVRLREIGAEEIELHRFPTHSRPEPERERQSIDLSWLEIQLDGLKVNRLHLDKSVAGVPLEYAVRSGGVALVSGRLSGGIAIGGDAEGWVEIDASLASGSGNKLELRAELERMNHPTFGLDRLSGSGEATIDATGVDAMIAARLEAKGQAGRISTRLHYADRELRLQQFQFNSPGFSAAGDLSLGFSTEAIEVALHGSLADPLTNNYTLQGTASIATSNKTWSVDVHSLEIRSWDVVSLSLAGWINADRMELKGSVAEFDLGLLPVAGLSGFTGMANGRFSISGPLEDPELAVGVEIAQLTGRKDTLNELPTLDFHIDGGVGHGRLFASTTMTHSDSGHLSADFSMPCTLSVSPFHFKLDPARMAGRFDSDFDLGVFNGLAMLDDQHIKGVLKARLALVNRIPSGFVKLEGGSYEHYDWGVLVRNCEAVVDATPSGFVVRSATATDGAAGRLNLTGGMRAGVLDVQLQLAQAKVLQRPEIDATVSGRLNLAGRILHPDITGRLVIDRAEFLPDNLVSAKPQLLLDYDAQAVAGGSEPVKMRNALPFGMDVRVEMPDQLYVNASLIDSVWGGSLHVRDTPAGLSVTGKIEPRRGYVSFIGKKFRFLSGEIVLDGSVPPSAVLNNLTAEYSRGDITARLVLNGRVADPRFRLESTPAMPQDEILSHVLFNRDTSSISPYQAYQIAAAAQQLSGGLNGPGFIYQFRQALGIDTLEWREPDAADDSSSVAAGKYITSGLYVEVNSTFGAEPVTGMTAEYEINRHFSVETSAGPKIRPGIGVNWRYDY